MPSRCRITNVSRSQITTPRLAEPDRIQNNVERQREKDRKDKRAREGPRENHSEQKVPVIGCAELKSPLSALWMANKQGATIASRFPRIWSTKGGQPSTPSP